MINLDEGQNSYLIAASYTKAKTIVQCCVELGSYYYVVRATGFLRSIDGMNALFIVSDAKILMDPVSKDNKRAKFSITLNEIKYRDKIVSANIIGNAFIIDSNVETSGKLSRIRLHFPNQYTVRQIRSSKRYELNKNINHYFKVTLPLEVPKNKEGIINLLREPSGYIIDSARIINLSRGGACICLPEEIAKPLLSAGTIYVLFFAVGNIGTPENTYLFTAKRLGLGNANCPSGIPIRMEFESELDIRKFSWIDIHGNGSPRLQKFLELNESEIPSDLRWSAD